ncbi:MAG: hypothetical protein LBQ69_00575 [Treponema sp.]|jgi:chromosome segregation ATPase|nr:hypothetical protein [Treponema sp.]
MSEDMNYAGFSTETTGNCFLINYRRILYAKEGEKEMGQKTVAEYASEIRSLEKQLSSLSKEQDEVNKNLSVENSALDKFQKEQEGLLKEIKAIGFFNFKEKNHTKEKLKEIRKKIKNSDTIINDLREPLKITKKNKFILYLYYFC